MPIVRMDQPVHHMTRQRKKRPVITFITNADTATQKGNSRKHGEPLLAKGSVCRQSLRNVSH
jgi:hypothetical protein